MHDYDLGCCEMVEHRIITVDVPPIYFPNYRCSQLENKYLNDEVNANALDWYHSTLNIVLVCICILDTQTVS